MTVMAAEAAEGGAARAAAARSSARSPAPRKPVTRTAGGIAPAEPGPRGTPGPAGPAGRPAPQPQVSSRQQDARGPAQRRSGPRAEKIHQTNYQPVILMEFVAAILLTAMTPVATKKDSQGLSPYAGADIVKLAAITVVYLILAMMSVGGRSWGRVAAWLGGLILLTDGLFEAANIAQDLQVFTGGGEPKTKTKAA